MFSYIDTIQNLPVSEKRALLKSIKSMIQEEVLLAKGHKLNIKAQKEAEKKAKIEAQIKAAQEKLAKLTAKLA